nr:PREDICTED: type IV inositol polyphosphate 5-phosphatase 9-like isoform X2 [Musa acuminata subsp. malaccensis]
MCWHILLLGLDWSLTVIPKLLIAYMALFDGASYGQLVTSAYKVFVGTWNVGGIPPSDDLDLENWMDTSNNSYDIYVLGFQEIIPLRTRNVLGLEESKMAGKWNSIIGATLNKSLPEQRPTQMFEPVEHRKVYPVKDGYHREREAGDFRCIISKQMVGILVSLWIRNDLLDYVSNPSVSCIGCGIMGCLRNKEGDEMRRNSNVMDILSKTCFSSDSSNDLPKKILDHDRIVLFGDLNYRISLPEAKTRSLVEQKEWNILLDQDQLRLELSEGRTLEGWNEGAITFSPTYKYHPNSDQYCWEVPGIIGERRRAPAWCDRILWLGEGLKQIEYERCESQLSDHRPVRAIFTAEVDAVVLQSSNAMDGQGGVRNG